jgi:hypothetical protein
MKLFIDKSIFYICQSFNYNINTDPLLLILLNKYDFLKIAEENLKNEDPMLHYLVQEEYSKITILLENEKPDQKKDIKAQEKEKNDKILLEKSTING